MEIQQLSWRKETGWQNLTSDQKILRTANLVLAFGSREILADASHYQYLKEQYGEASILFASSSGEICNDSVYDGSITATAVAFEHTRIRKTQIDLKELPDRYEVGKKIARELNAPDLKLIFVISDGQEVNGSALVEGLRENVSPGVPVTGGLAGDAENFSETLVGLDGPPETLQVAAIGFYGEKLQVGHGSRGGWMPFGPWREVTEARENELFAMDGKSALGLYKKYLGNRADELPGAALLFPLCFSYEGESEPLVRTVLSVDEERQSMIFAGNVPQGTQVRLMKANLDRLVDGAQLAAKDAVKDFDREPQLAFLVSCVGRKILMDQRVEEEIEEVRANLGKNTVMSGFYSYGEICPQKTGGPCQLHNQTMTITTLSENV